MQRLHQTRPIANTQTTHRCYEMQISNCVTVPVPSTANEAGNCNSQTTRAQECISAVSTFKKKKKGSKLCKTCKCSRKACALCNHSSSSAEPFTLSRCITSSQKTWGTFKNNKHFLQYFEYRQAEVAPNSLVLYDTASATWVVFFVFFAHYT